MNGFLLGILFIGGAVAYAVGGVLLTRHYVHHHVKEGHNDVLVPLFLTAGVIYAVLLGFMVVAVWESYDAAHETASLEAATLVPLYRQTFDMAPAPPLILSPEGALVAVNEAGARTLLFPVETGEAFAPDRSTKVWLGRRVLRWAGGEGEFVTVTCEHKIDMLLAADDSLGAYYALFIDQKCKEPCR